MRGGDHPIIGRAAEELYGIVDPLSLCLAGGHGGSRRALSLPNPLHFLNQFGGALLGTPSGR